jgi:small-conductance mechanosensitive channel
MLFTYSNNVLTIDNNDHYFRGNVDKSSFPDIIKEEYEEIIKKSFNNYSNNEMSVKNEFIEPYEEYKINFSYHSKPIFFNASIIISLEKHQKDFKDYMNERMIKLEEHVVRLEEQIKELNIKLEISKGVPIYEKESEIEDSTEQKEEEEEE